LYCTSCGQVVPEETKFCPKCGTRLEQQTTSSTAPTRIASYTPAFTGAEYIVEQKTLAMRDTFGVRDRNGNLLAYVKKKIVSFGPQFWFEAPDGARLGEMHGKVLTVRPTFEIYDAQNKLLAVVKKKMLKLLGSEWWLENESGQEVARIQGNITEHDFTILSTAKMPVARIHKKWVTVRDSYCVEITNQELDPYIIIAYAIAMDHVEEKGHGFNVGFGQTFSNDF
jgi:uncharacterized protein YxjI